MVISESEFLGKIGAYASLATIIAITTAGCTWTISIMIGYHIEKLHRVIANEVDKKFNELKERVIQIEAKIIGWK